MSSTTRLFGTAVICFAFIPATLTFVGCSNSGSATSKGTSSSSAADTISHATDTSVMHTDTMVTAADTIPKDSL